jgi:hypothetical protein
MGFNEISQIVETGLTTLQLNPAECRGAKPGQWGYKQRDANIWIDVFSYPDKPDTYYLQVTSPLCAVPDKRADAFYQDLLEINFKMYGSWMCKKDNWLYVFHLREAEGLDQSEFDATLNRVSFYSADYYGKLSFKYEGCWLPKAENPTGGGTPGPGQQ